MKLTTATALFAGLAAAGPVEITERQSCPKVKSAYSGAGSEAIVYPACGGQSQCGGIAYDNSASQGTAAVVKAVTAYNQKCPSTQIVLIGYSQVSNGWSV
jgi:acetylxylan esterase